MEERVPGEILPDTGSVLIRGPPMTGKYRLFVSMLSRSCERVGVVSTHARAERVRRDFADTQSDLPPERIGVVDCVRRTGGSGPPGDELVSSVASPMNLTEIGVEFTELAATFRDDPVDGRTGVGLHSISQLLMFSPVETVFRFLQVLTKQIAANGWVCLAVLDDTTVDEEVVRTLETLFDGVLETRERDDGEREYRGLELPGAPSAWTSICP